MNSIGQWSLLAAFPLAIYAVVASVVGRWRRRPGLTQSGENAALAVTFFITVAVAAIEAAIHTNDFSLAFVANHSSRDLPGLYKWTALWGGMEGSLLFWTWILCLYVTAVVMQGRRGVEHLMPYAIATLMTIGIFFIGVVNFVENPFEQLPFLPADGRGLNPLLQDPGMTFHPPSLYLGLVGMSVPFAFAMAALFTGRLDTAWIERTRKWTLAAWLFLGLANLLGGWWAYHVLGWGGYWGWDPVENSSFLPWLVTTAYLHSIQIEERRGMLRSWNMVLVIFAWLLTIIGTFLTRSGVVSSVHSFAEGPIGGYFLGFIIVSLVVSMGMLVGRARLLRSRDRLHSLFSREAAFLLNNLILLCGAFAVLWGTLFPILSEAVTGDKISVSAPFFMRIMVPVGLTTLILMGVGPLIAWRRANAYNVRRNFLWPTVAGLLGGVLLYALFGIRRADALICFAFAIFVLVGIVVEFERGIRVRSRMARENPAIAGVRVVSRARRRYGGYIVHLGVLVVFCGFAGSAFNRKAEGDVRPGESIHISGYDFVYEGSEELGNPSFDGIEASFLLQKQGKSIARLHPQMRVYHTSNEQQHTQVAIYSTIFQDFYMVPVRLGPGVVSVDVQINPLVSWVWGGGVILVAGTLIAIWPERRRARGALALYSEEYVSTKKAVGA